METHVDALLENLAPAIDAKCEELQEARRQRLRSRAFFLLCAAVAVVPALLVFAGVTLTLLIAPLAFASASAIFLLPVLLSNKNESQGGLRYEIV